MSPEEQLQVIESLAESLKDTSSDVRKEAFNCLIELGLDGLGRIIDVLDDAGASQACRIEAVQAIGDAFSEGKVDKSGMVKMAIKALDQCLTNPDEALCESAVVSLGEIGTEAISVKAKLLALLDGKRNNNRICVKIASALLKISPARM